MAKDNTTTMGEPEALIVSVAALLQTVLASSSATIGTVWAEGFDELHALDSKLKTMRVELSSTSFPFGSRPRRGKPVKGAGHLRIVHSR